jgi:hypothetical protein
MKRRTDPALAGRGSRRHILPNLPTRGAHPPRPGPEGASAPRGLNDKVAGLAVDGLKPFPENPRQHPEAQIARLMRSMEQVWTNPILIDETGTILASPGRWEAAKRLGRTEVPTLTITGLSAAEKRAVVIADNRLPEQAVWDFDLHARALYETDRDRFRRRADRLFDRRNRPAVGRQAGSSDRGSCR